MQEEWAHVDIGNQIDNSWNKDSVLALKINNLGFSVKIRAPDKKILEKKYLNNPSSRKEKKDKRRFIVLVYSFLLYKLLTESKGLANKVKLCNDVSPSTEIFSFLLIVIP